MNRKARTRRLTVFIVTVVAIFALVGIFARDVANSTTLGLDLQGGFEIVYQVSPLEEGGSLPDMSSVAQSVSKRINVLGISEPQIMIEGNDRIRVQLAGVQDQESARRVISSTANLTFRDVNDNLLADASIIEEGGVAPNIVPSHCVCKFFVRAADRDYLTELTRKVINCAKGAELMTGAKMSWRYFENSFDDLRCNPVLIDLMAKNLKDLGYDDFTTEEAVPSGSSDLGNVARVCPTCYLSLNAGNTDGSNCHEEAFLSHVNSETAYGRNLLAVKAMAATALDFLCDENVRKAIAK